MDTQARARFRHRSADPFWRNRRSFLAVFVALAVISATITARALLAVPTITVNSTADVADINPGDGLCDTGGTNAVGQPECTLRAAISELNANAGVTNIDFSIPVADPGHSGGIWTILPTTM
ncbi:MAG: CSLREA domain-containing protein, partial [Acidimicrobiales bacterium]